MVNIVRSGRQGERSLVRRPETSFMELRRRMDDLFSSLFGGFPSVAMVEPEEFRFWDLDLAESENEITVRAELPGFEPEEIDVQLQDELLSIKAERREKRDDREEHQTYRRSITLPRTVDVNKAQATYRNGVLELRIPRSEESRSRKIQVQGEKGQEAHIGEASREMAGAKSEQFQRQHEHAQAGVSPKSEATKETPEPKAGARK